MRLPWTIEERMPLHHLFALIGYTPKNDDWWRIYEEIQQPTRGRTVIYEDWKYGGGKKRGGMWETQIRIPFDQYTDAQRTAFNEEPAPFSSKHVRVCGTYSFGRVLNFELDAASNNRNIIAFPRALYVFRTK
jgi:hypothetical protein